MGSNPGYLLKSFLLYAKNIFAHVDLTKNLVFLFCFGGCILFLFYESRKICQKITLVAASLGFHIFECLSGNVLEKKENICKDKKLFHKYCYLNNFRNIVLVKTRNSEGNY